MYSKFFGEGEAVKTKRGSAWVTQHRQTSQGTMKKGTGYPPSITLGEANYYWFLASPSANHPLERLKNSSLAVLHCYLGSQNEHPGKNSSFWKFHWQSFIIHLPRKTNVFNYQLFQLVMVFPLGWANHHDHFSLLQNTWWEDCGQSRNASGRARGWA